MNRASEGRRGSKGLEAGLRDGHLHREAVDPSRLRLAQRQVQGVSRAAEHQGEATSRGGLMSVWSSMRGDLFVYALES